MSTAKIAEPIFGNKLYQKRAREALPILVRQAHAHTPITYSELAGELGMPNARNLNYVLGSIGQSLVDLSNEWKEEIPPIQCLVLNKTTGLPGEGIGWFITGDKEKFLKLSRKQQRSRVQAELLKVYSYQKWLKILKKFSLKTIDIDYSKLLSKVGNYNGGGESQNHLKLKNYVSKHPELFSIPKNTESITEFYLPSGDAIDVLFKYGNEWIGIEVKSEISNKLDITRGLFQCIKYQFLMEAYQSVEKLPQNARSMLVLGTSLPNELIPMKNILGVEVIENIMPK